MQLRKSDTGRKKIRVPVPARNGGRSHGADDQKRPCRAKAYIPFSLRRHANHLPERFLCQSSSKFSASIPSFGMGLLSPWRTKHMVIKARATKTKA